MIKFDLEDVAVEHATRREALIGQWRKQGMSEAQIARNIGKPMAVPAPPQELPRVETKEDRISRVFQVVSEVSRVKIDNIYAPEYLRHTTARRVAWWLCVHLYGATYEEVGCKKAQSFSKAMNRAREGLADPMDQHRLWHDAALARLVELDCDRPS